LRGTSFSPKNKTQHNPVAYYTNQSLNRGDVHGCNRGGTGDYGVGDDIFSGIHGDKEMN